MKIQLQDEVEEKDRVNEKNKLLEAELKTVKKLERSVQKIDRSKRKLEEEFRAYKVQVVVRHGHVDGCTFFFMLYR